MTDTVKLNENTVSAMKKYGLEDVGPAQYDHDYGDCPPVSDLSYFVRPIVPYIAGFAGKMTARSTECETCCSSLGSKTHSTTSSFIQLKDKGALFKPSDSVVKVCKLTELKVRQLLRTTEGKPPAGNIDFLF